MRPVNVAGAIVAVKYDSGILLASDTVINYGRSPRFGGISHFRQLTPTVLIGASGEFADFQALLDVLQRPLRQAECESHGQPLTVSEIYNLVKRYLYDRRSRINPLAVEVIVAGIAPNGASFVGTADLYGTAWEDDFACTGPASYLRGLQIERVVNKSQAEVLAGITDVWRALTRRSALAHPTIEIIDVTHAGITKLPPLKIVLTWPYSEGTQYGEELDC
jgi:20S proteasome subunit beta 7